MSDRKADERPRLTLFHFSGQRETFVTLSTRAEPLYHNKHAVWERCPRIQDICRPTNRPFFRFARISNPSNRSFVESRFQRDLTPQSLMVEGVGPSAYQLGHPIGIAEVEPKSGRVCVPGYWRRSGIRWGAGWCLRCWQYLGGRQGLYTRPLLSST
jgi:hypothetical protein